MKTRMMRGIEAETAALPNQNWKHEVSTGFTENAAAFLSQSARENISVSGVLTETGLWKEEDPTLSVPHVMRRLIREGKADEHEFDFAMEEIPEWEDDSWGYRHDFEKVGQYIRAKYGEAAPVELRSERLEERYEYFDELRAREADIASRSTLLGKAGIFAGAMVPYALDPPNLVATVAAPVMPWAAAARGSRITRNLALAGEQVLVEGAMAPSVAEHKHSLGLEYGSKEILQDMAMSAVGSVALSEMGGVLKKQIGNLRASKAASTVEGQKTIQALEEASTELDIIKRSGGDIEQTLDEADASMRAAGKIIPEKDLADEIANPEIRNFDDDIKLQEEFDAMAARRGEEIPIDAKMVDDELEIKKVSKGEILDELDDELLRAREAVNCYG